MRFSTRVNVDDLNPVAQAVADVKAAGRTVEQLNDSNPTHHGLAPESLPGVYTADPRGPLSMREAVARMVNARDKRNGASGQPDPLDPQNLYVLSSTSEAYAWLAMLLCDSGDAILFPTPGYPLIPSICALTGVKALPYHMFYDGSWCIDLASMEQALADARGAVRAICVINPNNPTGSYTKPDEREAIIKMAHDYNTAIIADEVFYEFALEPFDGIRRWAGETRVLTFALDGLSKMLGAPHAKVGWIEVSGPHNDVVEAQKHLDMIADDFLPMSDIIAGRIDDLLAETAAQTARIASRTRGNLALLHEMLSDDKKTGDGVTDVLRAEGGWNVLLHFPATIDENALGVRLVKDYNLNSQPGYYFDMVSNGFTTLSLLPEQNVFEHNVVTLLAAIHDELAG